MIDFTLPSETKFRAHIWNWLPVLLCVSASISPATVSYPITFYKWLYIVCDSIDVVWDHLTRICTNASLVCLFLLHNYVPLVVLWIMCNFVIYDHISINYHYFYYISHLIPSLYVAMATTPHQETLITFFITLYSFLAEVKNNCMWLLLQCAELLHLYTYILFGLSLKYKL